MILPQTIILAAGCSSRMGEDKALLQIKDTTLIRFMVEKLKPFSQKIIIVSGKNYQSLIKENLDAAVIKNADWQKGMFSSIQAGMRVAAEREWIMLHLIDHPFVASNTIEKLIDEISQEFLVIKPLVRKLNRSGHPILLNPVLIPKILDKEISENLKIILQNLPIDKIKYIDVDDSAVCDNINTPEQFRKALRNYNY